MIVWYDLETTGLVRGFDQIMQFGAVYTDDNLQEQARFQTNCRLMPHVVPAPDAMRITGQCINDLTDPSRPSHLQMISEIRARLMAWSPSLFVGWNSMRFDEEFLRQAFYQSLLPPYLTNTAGNSRADVLDIVRAVTALRPETVSVPRAADGRPSFRLEAIAPANGIPHGDAHDALADVLATLGVARLVQQRAPDLWVHFLAFARKSAVGQFIEREGAFVLLGRPGQPAAVAAIGPSPHYSNTIHCLDLAGDPQELAALPSDRLAAALRGGFLKKLKTNSAPLLWPLRDTPEHLLGGRDAGALAKKARALQERPELVGTLLACAEASEKVYPPSAHIEQQLYERGFWSDQDDELLAQFHASPWEARPSLLRQLADARLRRLGWRLLFIERPDLLTDEDWEVAARAMALRLLGLTGRDQPWLTVPDALLALEDGVPPVQRTGDDAIGGYRAWLAACLMNSAALLDAAKSPRPHDHLASDVDRGDHHGR
jgi:exodeoxyribonuclease I